MVRRKEDKGKGKEKWNGELSKGNLGEEWKRRGGGNTLIGGGDLGRVEVGKGGREGGKRDVIMLQMGGREEGREGRRKRGREEQEEGVQEEKRREEGRRKSRRGRGGEGSKGGEDEGR